MSTFFRYINQYAKSVNMLKKMYKANIFTVVTNNLSHPVLQRDGPRFKQLLESGTLTESERNIAVELFQKTIDCSADFIELMLISKAICNGPKLFRPKQFDLEMCELIKLNVEFNDYVQPFDTVVIELPDNYIKNKRVIDVLHPGNMHEPTFAILDFDKEKRTLFLLINFSSDVSIKISLIPNNMSENIEDYFTNKLNKYDHEFKGALYTSPDEWNIIVQVMRACINYCLLLDEIGIKKRGPLDASQYMRLQRYCKVAKKDTKHREERIMKANDNLREHPFIYEIDQEVKLVRVVPSHSSLGPSTDVKLSPHHRRGFYKMQHYGPNNSLTKRIRIAPVFVNKHLFLSDMEKTRVIYE